MHAKHYLSVQVIVLQLYVSKLNTHHSPLTVKIFKKIAQTLLLLIVPGYVTNYLRVAHTLAHPKLYR